MKKAYLAIDYQNRRLLDKEVDIIREILNNKGYDLFVFVDEYHFSPHEEKAMMQKAFEQIRSSDLLIAEVSEKAIGVGIEIGYAAALQKKIIYLRNSSSAHSTTASGSADDSVIYTGMDELSAGLENILQNECQR